MYKDKNKQREANRQAKRAQRARDNEPQGMTLTRPVIPESDIRVIPERTAQGNIRVSKPGDSDYVPMCETTKAFIEGKPKTTDILKHIGIQPDKSGKDIKYFGDLPMDVQASIDRLSVVDGKINPTIKANRTAIAVNYQHQFPDRFHSTGVV